MGAMTINEEFQLGELVTLVADTDSLVRMVTGITVRPTGLLYLVTHCTTETQHYAIELLKHVSETKKAAGFGRKE